MKLILTSLIIIWICAYLLNNKELFSPSILFSSSFLFSSLWAILYVDKWDLYPSKQTQLVIILGVLEFVAVASLVHILYNTTHSELMPEVESIDSTLSIDFWKIALIVFMELLTILMTIRFLKNISPGSLSTNIYIYRKQLAFGQGQKISLPTIVKMLQIFTTSVGYYFGYLIVREYIKKRNVSLVLLTPMIISLISGILMGARTGMIVILISLITSFYVLIKKDHGWQSISVGKNIKMLIIGLFAFFILLYSFQNMAVLLGRTIEASPMDYLAEYFGAEIKNLDIFIQKGTFPIITNVKGSQTFVYLMGIYGKLIGVADLSQPLDLPFNRINGYDLGNVATTFYPYLYDFGYKGVIICIFIMSFVSQIVYEKVRRIKNKITVPISVLIYGYVSSSLILSFFSNKFYENFFSPTFVYTLLCWLFLNFFIGKLSVK